MAGRRDPAKEKAAACAPWPAWLAPERRRVPPYAAAPGTAGGAFPGKPGPVFCHRRIHEAAQPGWLLHALLYGGAWNSPIFGSGLWCALPHYLSHQDGHIAAALYSGDRLDWIGKEFLAFHVSGGTTEAVLVRPHAEGGFSADLLASSLDLKAGQAIDRVGVMLGLPFPAGRALEELALRSSASFRIRPSMKGASCSLSGIENKCRNMVERGTPPEDIALFCLLSVEAALDAMAAALLQERPGLPLLFAGGVMSNSILRRDLTKKYGATFAEPAFSSDNAAGVAVLAALAEQKGGTA